MRLLEKLYKSKFPNWLGYIWGPVLAGLFTVLGLLEQNIFSNTNMMLFYLLCAFITSAYGGLGPAILVSILSIIFQDYFFVRPYLSFGPPHIQDILSLMVLLAVSILTSYFSSKLRQSTLEAKRRELESSTLYSISRDLGSSVDLNNCLNTLINQSRSAFGIDIFFFLPDSRNHRDLKPYSENPEPAIDGIEISPALWSYEQNKESGYQTNMFSDSRFRYFPLITARNKIGVMAARNDKGLTSLSNAEIRFLRTFADLSAVTIENIHLIEQNRNIEILKASEKLQTALLNSISHDLRTPLSSVIGALSSIQEEGMQLSESDKIKLFQIAREEADRLNHLIGNLLDISRIEGGSLRLTKQPSEIADVIGVALEQLNSRTASHKIEVDLPENISFADIDFNLIVQVLVNILDNALKYSSPGSIINIIGSQNDREVILEIADRGKGIPQENLEDIFHKSYRVHRPDGVSGTGLGLAICKGFIEAHGGHIYAKNRLGGGTIISLTLPIASVNAGQKG